MQAKIGPCLVRDGCAHPARAAAAHLLTQTHFGRTVRLLQGKHAGCMPRACCRGLLTSTSSGFSGPPVAEGPCAGHQKDSGRTRADTAHSAAALPSTKVKMPTIPMSWWASGLRRWVAGAADLVAWQSRSHRSLGGPGFESTTVVLRGMLCCGGTRAVCWRLQAT